MAETKDLKKFKEEMAKRGFPPAFAQAVLEIAQAVDAVEVVRCKDYVYRYNTEECLMREEIYGQCFDNTADDAYCDLGQRREDGRSDRPGSGYKHHGLCRRRTPLQRPRQAETYCAYNEGWNDACDYIRARLESVKAAEAVEIVRCRNCAKDDLPTCFLCYIENHAQIFINHDPDFFCGAEERKENA